MSKSRSVGQSGIFCGERCQKVSGSIRISTNLSVRDLGLSFVPHDARRLAVVADGLLLLEGSLGHRDHSCVSRTCRRGSPRSIRPSERDSPCRSSQSAADGRRRLDPSLDSIDRVLSCLTSSHDRLSCPCLIVVQLWGAITTTPRSDAVVACRYVF